MWDSVHELWGTVDHARTSDAECLVPVGGSGLSGRVTRYSFGERCDIVFIMFFVLIYLIVFITGCFIRKWHIEYWVTVCLLTYFFFSNWFLYLLVGLLIACLVGCLVIFSVFFCCWLVSRFGWLALVHSGAGWLLAWPHHDHFTPWFHKTQVQCWPQWLVARM